MAHSDGGLDFLARIGDQIKLRGYRIHIEDVAQAFRAQQGVREAVATPLNHTRHGECLAIASGKFDRKGKVEIEAIAFLV